MQNVIFILAAAALAVPALVLRTAGIHISVPIDTAIYGLAIVSAAFLLAWAAEASEVDIPQSLAVAFVALVAVLPEYAVDMTFAWKAGQDPAFAPLAIANMTGGNRLIIGAAWPFVFALFWLRTRSRILLLEHGHAIEVGALALATLYAFVLPLKGEITLWDSALLGALFVVYVIIIGRAPTEEPELIGPARAIGTLPGARRRTIVVVLFLYAATAIIVSAERFAEGLVHTGIELGLDEFLLVQWLAPLASEAPEFLFAGIMAYRGRASMALGALLSSTLNQWTLLVGGLAIAYALSSGGVHGLPLDARQTEEVLLTAAQSLFAVALVSSLSFTWREAVTLGGLFLVSFLIPNRELRLGMAALYVVLSVIVLASQRGNVRMLFRAARESILHPGGAGQ